MEAATLVQAGRAQVGGLEGTAVQGHRLDILRWRIVLEAVGADRRLDQAAGLHDELGVAHPDRGPLERGRVDQEQVLPGDGEEPERGPDIPGAEPAGVVVARQAARPGAELPGQPGVHDLRGAIGTPGPVIGPGRLQVRLVVQALEPVQRVPGQHLGHRWAPAGLFDRLGAVAEEAVQHAQEGVVTAGQGDPGGHVVQQPERVVPLAALVEGGVAQQPGGRVERVDPAAAALVQVVGQAPVVHRPGHLGGAVVGVGQVEGVRDRVHHAVLEEVLAVHPAQVVHSALTWQFGTGAGGLPGNDDSGGLSSWYVWASLGLFPVAGQSLFLVNAPAFERSALHLGGGREFVVETSGHVATPIGADGIDHETPAQYVQSATLNGKPLDATHLRAADVHRGGRLHLRLGPAPSSWGRGNRPPSTSDH